jgi:hypothetical protein
MSVAADIDALAERGRWFSATGRVLFRIGLCASPLCACFYWGPPQGADQLQSYLRLPAELAAHLQSARAPITLVPPFLITPGGDLARLTIYPIVLLLMSLGLKAVAVPRVVRACLLPLLFIAVFFLTTASEKKQQLAARVGTVVDHAGAPLASRDGTEKQRVAPYVLNADLLAPGLSDQAHYVLAQQAYLEGRPDAVAGHLRAIKRAAPFPDSMDRRLIGILDAHAKANGYETGHAAQEISQGSPHYLLNAVLWWAVLMGGIVALAIGLMFIAIGDSRQATTRKLFDNLSKA